MNIDSTQINSRREVASKTDIIPEVSEENASVTHSQTSNLKKPPRQIGADKKATTAQIETKNMLLPPYQEGGPNNVMQIYYRID